MMDLIAPQYLLDKYPLEEKTSTFISESRKTIKQIFDRQDPRLLLIVGPCSIHKVEEALVYARKLKMLAEKVKEKCFIVMRAYVEKPRTRRGWRGLIHDPHLNESHDLSQGLELARCLLMQLAEMELPAATEFLTPQLSPYIEDLISWGCIGARTCSSQIHRLLASHLPMPVGFKNSVDGNIDCAIDGIHVARHPQCFVHTSERGNVSQKKSNGNPYAHIVLRGSTKDTNYDPENIQKTLTQLRQHELPARIMIDCSHGNAKGKYFFQKNVFQSILTQIQEGNHQIFGIMLESNLEASSQLIPSQLTDLQPGVSITDPCLDFGETEELISTVSSGKEMSLTQS